MIKIDSDGSFEPVPLWEDEEILFNGLKPRQKKLTYPFRQDTLRGTCELRFFISLVRVSFLLFPHAPATKSSGFTRFIEKEKLERIKMKTIHYTSLQESPTYS